jgi:hypothetical protein
MTRHHPPPQNGKLYYIDSPALALSEELELYTWEDACEVVQCCRRRHPEGRHEIREFEAS